jgi:hypothetical protein
MRRRLWLLPLLLAACASTRPVGEASRTAEAKVVDASAPPPSDPPEVPKAGSPEACLRGAEALEAELTARGGDKEQVKHTLDEQLADYRRFDGHSKEETRRCANATAAVLVETAMSWQREVFGSGGRRGTGDPETMELTVDLLREVTSTFPSAELATFRFPHLAQSSVTPFKLKYALADLYYFLRRWDDCGRAFDAALAEDPRGREAAEVAYASDLCRREAARERDGGAAGRDSSH